MKKFRFRLEALLKLREQKEKDRQRELAASVRKTNEQRERLDSIHEHSRSTQEYKRSIQNGPLAVHQLQMSSRFLGRLQRDAYGAKELLQALKKTESERREALLKAARDKKIYEKLKEKQERAHYREAAKLATKDADETGLNTFRANQRAGKRQNEKKAASV